MGTPLTGSEKIYVSQGGNGNGVVLASDLGAYIVGLVQAGGAVVTNGQNVTIQNSSGSESQVGTAVVASGNLSNVSLPATAAIITNGGVISVSNSAQSQSQNATCQISGGVPQWITFAATVAIVTNTEQLTVPVTGAYVTKATLTVANGVVTAIALS